MSGEFIEHKGVVQRFENGIALVAIETGGCSSCGHGSSCGVGKMAAGRPATLLKIPVSTEVRSGDFVTVGIPASKLTLSGLLGYLFPGFAMLFGAWFGNSLQGSDAGTALGAIAGFLIALIIARLLLAVLPEIMPAPQLLPVSNHSRHFSQE